MNNKPRLIVIGGPTASGKTAAAVRLCQRIDGEVVSSDSMQIYRGMDIGTAKASKIEQNEIKHHMIDIADPDENWSLVDFAAAAQEVTPKCVNRRVKTVIPADCRHSERCTGTKSRVCAGK